MKQRYFIFFFFCAIGLFAQDTTFTSQGDIEGFKLYPNPATSNTVYITTTDNAHKNVRIYDVFGELVLTDRLTGHRLDISRLSPGVYVVQVHEGQRSSNRKLVVK